MKCHVCGEDYPSVYYFATETVCRKCHENPPEAAPHAPESKEEPTVEDTTVPTDDSAAPPSLSEKEVKMIRNFVSYGRLCYIFAVIALIAAGVAFESSGSYYSIRGSQMATPLFRFLLAGMYAALGAAVRSLDKRGRTFSIVLAAILLPVFPIGTVMGIAGLWLMLNRVSRSLFRAHDELRRHPQIAKL
jgi:hypothetical protein